MKQKIIIKIQLDCDKCRSKALKIAAQEKGVSSVALEGEERDKLVVTGEVDAVCLARVLRKKFRSVTLVSVAEVKKKDAENKCKIEDNEVCYYYTPYCPPPSYGPSCYTTYDPYASNCSIM